MNKTTKILLVLGLLIAVVIPVTVKELFTDTDFFESSESSSMEYLQPYKIRPETAIHSPNDIGNGNIGDLNINETSRSRSRQTSSYKPSRQLEKVNLPMSDASNMQSESVETESEDIYFK